MRATKRYLLPLACLVIAGLACNILNPTPVAWSLTVTPDLTVGTQAPPVIRSVTSPATLGTPIQPVPTQTKPPVPSPSNSWVVYARADGETLVVHKPGQAESALISLPGPLLSSDELRRGASPNGEWLAVRTGNPDYSELALQLIHLPDGQIKTITPLLSPSLEKQVLSSPSGRALDAALAVVEGQAVRWSSKGKQLAFIGAVSGSSSDVYVYDVSQDKLSRLTSGSRQAATPIWSPDEKWVVHQEVETFGTDKGWRVNSVLAAASDHNEIRRLFATAEGSAGEVFLGWNEGENLLLYTWRLTGAEALREIPLSLRWLKPIFDGPFDEIALDPVNKGFLISAGEQTSLRARLLPGLYWISDLDGEPDMIQVGEWHQMTWWENPGIFTASGVRDALTIRPDRTTQVFKDEGWLAPSPDGLWLAGWSDRAVSPRGGVRLYRPDGRLLQEISSASTQQLAWLPDSTGFFYLSGDQLYQFAFPGAQGQLVDEDVYPVSLIVLVKK